MNPPSSRIQPEIRNFPLYVDAGIDVDYLRKQDHPFVGTELFIESPEQQLRGLPFPPLEHG